MRRADVGNVILSSNEETMMLPLKELAKLNQIIARIQNGRFDANDVDGLLIKLRPYANSRKVFREISHFVAHSNARDQGIALESITSFVDSIRYFQEYAGANRQLDLRAPFPLCIYRLFLSQARLADKQQLKSKFKMSPETLINKIKVNFEVDANGTTYSLRSNKGGVELFEALQYVTGFIHSRPAFHLRDFHKELKEVMRSEKVAFDESLWDAQIDHISLAILCLVSNTTFVLADKSRATCKLETENHFRLLFGERRLPTGAMSSEPKTFGNLMIHGEATINSASSSPLRVSFPLIDTDLDPHQHCDLKLFLQEKAQGDFSDCLVEIINLAPDMSLTEDFKLVRTDSLIH